MALRVARSERLDPPQRLIGGQRFQAAALLGNRYGGIVGSAFSGLRGEVAQEGLALALVLGAASLLVALVVTVPMAALRFAWRRSRGDVPAAEPAEPAPARRRRHGGVRVAAAIGRVFLREGLAIFIVVLGVDLLAAYYLVFHLNYVPGDAFARVANSFYVLFSRDPHLAAIGFIWAPLPSFLELPIIAFRGVFPELVTRAFAGCILSSVFAAATAALVNAAFREHGVAPPLRWLFVAAYAFNPLILYYGANGMSESMLMFFLVASTLLFLRWTRTHQDIHLVALGVVTGVGTFVRYEAWVFAAMMGLAVTVVVVRRTRVWREIETKFLLYLLPVGYSVVLWIGANAVIQRDPLYFAHGPYANDKEAAATHLYDSGALRALKSWPAALRFVANEIMTTFPIFILAVVLLAVVLLLRRRDLISGAALVAVSVAILGLQVLLIQRGLSFLYQRFFMSVIPFSFLILAYALGHVRAWWLRQPLAVPLVVLLLAGNVLTLLTMNDPLYNEEQPVLAAAIHNSPSANQYFRSFDEPRRIATAVDAYDRTGAPVVADSWMAFKIVMNAPRPNLFVVTSDRDFEPAVNEPTVHHVRYFLVPEPTGLGTIDRINRLFPTFWASGGGFGRLVADLGGDEHWRLYEIVGQSSR